MTVRHPHHFSNPTAALIGVLLVGLFVWLFNAYRIRRIRSGAKFGGDRRDRILLTCGILGILLLVIVIRRFV